MANSSKLVQPSITSYFNFRKNDPDGKENSFNSQACMSQRSVSIPKRSREKSIKLSQYDSETNKNTRQTCIKTESIPVRPTPSRPRNSAKMSQKPLKNETFSGFIETEMMCDDSDVQFTSITISLDSDDENLKINDEDFIQKEDTSRRKFGKSPSKMNIETSSSKKIKHENSPGRRELFNDSKTDLKAELLNVSDDIIDLAYYGIPVEELESYEPSINDSQLTTSFNQINFVSLKSNHKNNDFNTVPNLPTPNQFDCINIKIKHEVDEIDLNKPSGSAMIKPINKSFNSTKSEDSDPAKTLPYEYEREYLSITTNTTLFLESSSSQSKEAKENKTHEFPIEQAMMKAWNDIQKTPYIDFHSDKHLLDIIFTLGDRYLEICLRLYARQSKWQRLDKFLEAIKMSIDENDLEAILVQLSTLKCVYTDIYEKETVPTVLNILQMSELSKLAKARRLKQRTKPAIVAALNKFVNQQRSVGPKTTKDHLFDDIKKLVGRCVYLHPDMREALFRLQLLHHFAVPDITTYYEFYSYVDDIMLGRILLPKFKVRKDVLAFSSREHFERYATATFQLFTYNKHKEQRMKKSMKTALLAIAQNAFYTLKTLRNTEPDVSPIHHRFTAENVYVKILTYAITDLTHTPDVVSWLEFLINQKDLPQNGEWYDKLALHLENSSKNKEAAEIINHGLSHKDVSNIDKINLTIRAERLIKRKSIQESMFGDKLVDVPFINDIQKTIIDAKPCKVRKFQGTRMVYEADEQFLNVEEFALRHYKKNGFTNGVHCEGALLMTLFAALFWDIIYSDIPGAFISPLQYIPLDLYSREFYRKRQVVITKRLKDISIGWTLQEFLGFLYRFNDLHLIKKSVHDVTLGRFLVEAADCIGRHKLAQILERLVKDIRQYRAGLPDLFIWNNINKKYNELQGHEFSFKSNSGNACLNVREVKSHNDKLSRKQEVWLEFLHSIDVRVELCLVNSIGEKVPKSRMPTKSA